MSLLTVVLVMPVECWMSGAAIAPEDSGRPTICPTMPTQNAPIPAIEPLLSLAKTAEIIDVNPTTLRRFIARGEIKVITIGGRRKVEPVELRRYLDARRELSEAGEA